MRIFLSVLAACALASCAMAPLAADPASDAPERRVASAVAVNLPASYADALGSWRSAEDVNAWIGTRFEYDHHRAAQLSESQRALVDRVRIHEPEAFFAAPAGVCVDLARFAVETLRVVVPASRPTYLMIEFDPAVISGNLLRRHWLVMFEREGQLYFFADSKRPGHVAGPYATVQQFIDSYAQYRGRRIVSHRSLDSYERRLRTRVLKAARPGGSHPLQLDRATVADRAIEIEVRAVLADGESARMSHHIAER